MKIERTFHAPPETLWALWTTKEGVESWWGPEGFTTTVRKLDLRPGGEFEYENRATAPEQIAGLKELGLSPTSSVKNIFTEVVPPRRLAMRTQIDFVPGVEPYEITTVFEFRALRGGTKLVFTSSKMHSEQWTDLAKRGQMSQFDKLGRILGASRSSQGSGGNLALALPSDREILITRVFDAPRERVFKAHVDSDAVEDWWGPREYSTKVDTWDLRLGGSWRIVQHAPDGTEHGFRGVFQEILPSERLAWTFEYEGAPGHVSTQRVTFEDYPGGRTKLTVRSVFANRGDRDGMVNSGMEWGMRQSYEKLDELLERGG